LCNSLRNITSITNFNFYAFWIIHLLHDSVALGQYDFSWMNKSSYLLNHRAINCLLYRINKTSKSMAWGCSRISENPWRAFYLKRSSYEIVTKIFIHFIIRINVEDLGISTISSCPRSRSLSNIKGEGGAHQRFQDLVVARP
jgi:hypothetical protein